MIRLTCDLVFAAVLFWVALVFGLPVAALAALLLLAALWASEAASAAAAIAAGWPARFVPSEPFAAGCAYIAASANS